MLATFWSDFERVSWYTQLVLAAQVGCAVIAGAIVGMEREWAGKRAGLRTHVMVAAASALAVGIGEAVLGGRPGDATRVFHGVLTGVGFIGAGAILHGKRLTAAGLTTAATVFFVAVLGAVAAYGAPTMAVFAALAGVVTLRLAHTVFERPVQMVRRARIPGLGGASGPEGLDGRLDGGLDGGLDEDDDLDGDAGLPPDRRFHSWLGAVRHLRSTRAVDPPTATRSAGSGPPPATGPDGAPEASPPDR